MSRPIPEWPRRAARTHPRAGRPATLGEQIVARQGVLDVPILQAATSTLERVLHNHQTVGTHGLFIGRIVATSGGDGSPLINFQSELRTLLRR